MMDGSSTGVLDTSVETRITFFTVTSAALVFAAVVPSGSSRGAMPRLRRANVKARWTFSLGSLEELALRSTKAGFMDLIRARNARPLLQLLPKSSTSTPNLRSDGGHTPFNLTSVLDSGSRPHSLRRASSDPLQQSVDGLP